MIFTSMISVSTSQRCSSLEFNKFIVKFKNELELHFITFCNILLDIAIRIWAGRQDVSLK